MVSVIGSWMQTVAVGALVVAHTGKATWAVVIAAGAFLPIGLLSPVGGALADRIPRRAALVVGNLLAGLVALVIALLVAARQDSPGILTLLVTIQGSVSALIGPFQQAILPDLVPTVGVLGRGIAQLRPVQSRARHRPRSGRGDDSSIRVSGGLRRQRGRPSSPSSWRCSSSASHHLRAQRADKALQLRSVSAPGRRSPSLDAVPL